MTGSTVAVAEPPRTPRLDVKSRLQDETRLMPAPEVATGSGWGGWFLGLCCVLGVLVGSPAVALGMYQYGHIGRVYEGVSILGIDLSGKTREEAEQLVAARAAELTAKPVLIRAGDNQWRTDWTRLGLTMPVKPVVDRAMAVGRQGSLPDQWYAQARALRSGLSIPIEETLDESAIRAFVETASQQIDRPVRNARLVMLPDLTFEMTTAQAGRRLEQDESIRLIREAMDQSLPSVELPVTTLQPVTTDEMRLAAKAKAEQIVEQPAVLSAADKQWTVDRNQLAELLVFSGGPGVPIDVKLDAAKVRAQVEAIAAEIKQEPKDATVTWADGALKATAPSQEGRQMDVDAATKQALTTLESGGHQVMLPVSVTKPKIDSNRLEALGIKELIDSASTSFAGSVSQKQHNVRLAASRLNDTLVAPGEKFSFNKALGPTTLDNGYQVAFGIMSDGGADHKTVPSVAGGICQVATTLFQPVFWSGYQIEERHWHLYWIPAYASKGVVGLDATVDEEVNLDLQFVNTSQTYLLIQSKTDDSSITFNLYGTKPSWTVKVDGPTISDQKPADPTPVVEYEPSLPDGQRFAVESAREGFTASFVRTVTPTQGQARTLRIESKYVPSRNVTLVGTGGRPAPKPTAGPSSGSGR